MTVVLGSSSMQPSGGSLADLAYVSTIPFNENHLGDIHGQVAYTEVEFIEREKGKKNGYD